MLTPFDRKQQAAELAKRHADIIAKADPATLRHSCDWNAELAKLAKLADPNGGAA